MKLELVAKALQQLKLQVPVIRSGDLIEEGSIHWDRLSNHFLPVLREAETQITKASPIGTKSSRTGKIEVVSSINLVKSVVDGMEQQELSHAEVKEAMAKLTNYLGQGVSKIAEVVSAYAAKSEPDEGSSIEQAAATAQDEQLFARMASHAQDLPVNGSKEADPFVLKRMPVVPVFKSPVSTKQLADIGFKVVTNEGFYTVLGDQLVIGINVAKGKHKDILTYAHQIASIVGQKLGEHLSIMGVDLKLGAGRQISRSKGYIWFWLVPHTLLTRMNNPNAKAKGMALHDWGFPFK